MYPRSGYFCNINLTIYLLINFEICVIIIALKGTIPFSHTITFLSMKKHGSVMASTGFLTLSKRVELFGISLKAGTLKLNANNRTLVAA